MRKSSQIQRLTKRFGSISRFWNIVPIGDLFRERRETSNDTARYPLHSLTIEAGIVPKTERYDRTFLLRNEEENEYKLAYPGDFVFNPMNLRFGAIAYSRHEVVVAVSAYYNTLKPVQDKFDARYLFELLTSHQMIDLYDVVATGSLVEKRRVHWSELRELLVPLPPLSVQKKIGAIVGVWNQAIALTEWRIEAARQRKMGLMQRLLTGRVRFPEFVHSTKRRKTKFGDLPVDWEYVPISKVAKEVNVRNQEDRDYPVLSCTKHYGLVDSLEYFGRQIFSDDLSSYRVVKRGQFAYATNHIEEGSIGYQDLHDVALISPMYTVFETNDRVDDSFLYKVLKTEKYRHIFEINTNGTVNRRGSLRWNVFSRIPIPLPSLAEQHRIAAVLQACNREIELLTQKRDALQQQKKGLMQRLLTGRVRVNV